MTVSSEVKRADYVGNDSTTNFSTVFRFLDNTHVKVILTVDATGAETVQALDTNYTLTGVGDDSGGNVLMIIAPATGETLTIKRDIPLTQGTDYVENDDFPAASHEDALDKLTMITQQVQEELDRSLKLTESQASSGLTVPAPEEGLFLQWDAAGNLLNKDILLQGALSVSEFAKTYLDDPDAPTTRATLGLGSASVENVGTAANEVVQLNGSAQLPAVDGSLLTGVRFPRNHIDGLITSNGTDAAHDIDIAVGECSDSTNTVNIKLTSGITKQIDANWAEGTNTGGFPSALTLTADTWYHVFTIEKPDGTEDAGFDTSLTAVNLLSDATGYTLYRLVWSMLTDGSANVIPYSQKRGECLFNTPVTDINATNPGTSEVLATMSSPLGIKAYPITTYQLLDGSPTLSSEAIFTSPDQLDVAPSTTILDVRILSASVGESASVSKLIRTNASSQIRFRLSSSDAGVLVRAVTFGFIHPRGKE